MSALLESSWTQNRTQTFGSWVLSSIPEGLIVHKNYNKISWINQLLVSVINLWVNNLHFKEKPHGGVIYPLILNISLVILLSLPCLPYSFCDVSLENLALDQLKIP